MVGRRTQKTGFSLVEIIFVISLILVVVAIIAEPLSTILRYPLKVRRQRTDRIAGQHIYNRLFLDLRNSPADKVWKNTDVPGETLVLITAPSGYNKADSPGPDVYTLWKYSSEQQLLSRRRWTKSQLAEFGLTIADTDFSEGSSGSAADEKWSAFRAAPLVPMASYVTDFSFEIAALTGFQVSYSIKNPDRDGKVEQYRLEPGHL